MTSTVLDVTVLLLCVSASVVVLGGVDVDPGPSGGTAADAADRLTTETATVRYAVDGGDGGHRSVHATLVELLVAAVDVETEADTTAARFRSLAFETVADALGARTRVDVRRPIRSVDRTAATAAGNDEVGGERVTGVADEAATMASVGSLPPRDADVSVAVVRHPASVARAETEPLRIVVRVW
jgi:hypothetical protein